MPSSARKTKWWTPNKSPDDRARPTVRSSEPDTRSVAVTRQTDHSVLLNDTATTEIYTLSLHDALPITGAVRPRDAPGTHPGLEGDGLGARARDDRHRRSEEHTSELQSRGQLVCRLLLEKKKNTFRRPDVSSKLQKRLETR